MADGFLVRTATFDFGEYLSAVRLKMTTIRRDGWVYRLIRWRLLWRLSWRDVDGEGEKESSVYEFMLAELTD